MRLPAFAAHGSDRYLILAHVKAALAVLNRIDVLDGPVEQDRERPLQRSPSGVGAYSTPSTRPSRTLHFVDRLARNIAALPEGGIAAAKKVMPPTDLREVFSREHGVWAGLFTRPAAEQFIRGGLNAGAQTREDERNLEGLLRGPGA